MVEPRKSNTFVAPALGIVLLWSQIDIDRPHMELYFNLCNLMLSVNDEVFSAIGLTVDETVNMYGRIQRDGE
jgi:hypothetical protein